MPRLRSSNECLTYENARFSLSFSTICRHCVPLSFSLSLFRLRLSLFRFTGDYYNNTVYRTCAIYSSRIPSFCSPSVFFSALFDRAAVSRARARAHTFPRILLDPLRLSFPTFLLSRPFFASPGGFVRRPQVAAINAKTTRRFRALSFLPRNCSEKSAFKVITCCSRVINFRPAGFPFSYTLHTKTRAHRSRRGKERTKTRSTAATGNENNEPRK